MHETIALLTDFGLRDTYVAAIKAVILSTLPSVNLLDLTHDISPGDLPHAAFEAWRIKPYLPGGAILLGVVDPGVGTARRPIAIEFQDFQCVGPDNGLFSYLLEIDDPLTTVELYPGQLGLEQVSNTFHGRDLFAPAAASLAGGTPIDTLGPKISDLARLNTPQLGTQVGGSIRAEILHIDRFGNLITSIGLMRDIDGQIQFSPWLGELEGFEFLPEQVRIRLENAGPLELFDTFGAVPSGAPLAYIGSTGLLEIAVRDGNAALTFHAQRGDQVNMEIT